MGSEVRGVFDLRSQEVRGPSIRPSQGCIFGKGPRSADKKGGNKRIEGHGNGLVVAVVAPVTFRYGSSEGSDPQHQLMEMFNNSFMIIGRVAFAAPQ